MKKLTTSGENLYPYYTVLKAYIKSLLTICVICYPAIGVAQKTPPVTLNEGVHNLQAGDSSSDELTAQKSAATVVFDFESGTLPGNFEQVTSGTQLGSPTSSNSWHLEQSSYSYQGGYSLRSGYISHNQNSYIRLWVDIESEGTLQFKYLLSSETDYDVLYVLINGELITHGSGSVNWSNSPTFSIPSGSYYIDIIYAKDGSTNSGLDAIYLDDITITGMAEASAPVLDIAITNVHPKTAAPGTNITLFGVGFSTTASQNSVTIGDVEANVLSSSSNHITFTLPEVNPGHKTISVANANGSATWSDLFSVLYTSAPIFSSQNVSTVTANSPYSMVTTDVNGDGILDIVYGSYNTNRVIWLPGNGNGGYYNGSVITDAVPSVMSVAAGDIDNDGDIDIVSASYSNSSIYLHINTGEGAFAPYQWASQTAQSVYDIKLADLNNDGFLDIVAAEYGSNEISWYRNLGNGTFSSENNIHTGYSYFSVFPADINNDGFVDIVAGTLDGVVAWFKNQRDGTFSNPQQIDYIAQVYSVHAADFNGDGYTDIISSSYTNQTISLYTNNGDETFSNTVIATSRGNITHIEAGDIDGNGTPDIIYSTLSNSTGTLINNGNGTFSYFAIPFTTNTSYSATFADIDGDGDLDILATNYGSSVINIAKNTSFPEAEPIEIAITKVSPNAGISGSLVRLYGKGFSANPSANTVLFDDTQATIIGAAANWLNVMVPENLEPGFHTISITNENGSAEYAGHFNLLAQKEMHFRPKASGIVGLSQSASAFADIDGDGDLDFIISGRGEGNQYITKIYTNEDGNFTEKDSDLRQLAYSSVAVGDVNNDGSPDLFLTGIDAFSHVISVLYLNDGSGSFTDSGIPFTGVFRSAAAFADLDNDGDLDLVITGQTASGRASRLYWNQGNGNFLESYQEFEDMAYSSVQVEDFTGTGTLDILFAGLNLSSTESTLLYANNGDGTFSVHASGLPPMYNGAIATADVNQDGSIDVFITGRNSGGNLSGLYLNNGSGNFTKSGLEFKALAESSAQFADLDGDGFPELILSGTNSSNQRETAVYINKGNGDFALASQNFTGISLGEIAVGDINNDGDLDVIFSGLDQNSIPVAKLYESLPPPALITSVEVEAAAPGTEVTLYGRGFAADIHSNIVTLGSEQAMVTYADSASMRIIIPEITPGIYTLKFTNDNAEGTYTGAFTVLNKKRAYFTDALAGITDYYQNASVFGDIDGDGDVDLLITGYASGQLQFSVLTNNGFGSFVETEHSITATRMGTLNLADFDDDGDLDLLVTGYSNSGLKQGHIYLNNNGSFEEFSWIEGVDLSATSIADVDNDGDLDIFVTGRNSANQYISKLFLNDGSGVFQESAQSFEPVQYGSSDFGDINGDGNLDLILSGRNTSNIPTTYLYLNDGNGNFTNSGISNIDGIWRGASIIQDVNRDGLPDVFVGGYNQASQAIAKLFINNGDGTFSQNASEFPALLYLVAKFGDVDGDGDYDIFVQGLSGSERQSHLYLNDGDGNFYDSNLIFIGVGEGSVEMADVNNDGDLDIFLTGYTGSEVISTLYENIIPPGPSNLTAEVNGDVIELNWNPSPLTNIGGHNIYRSLSDFTSITDAEKINTELVTSTTFTDTNLEPDTRYYYRVTAIDSLDGEESVGSNLAIGSYKVKSIFASSADAAIAGKSITLFGTNLSANTGSYAISLGDKPVNIISAAINRIIFEVPDIKPGNYLYSIVADGKEMSYPQLFTVLEDEPEESGYFQPEFVIANEINGVKSPLTANLNHDGRPDLLVAASDDNTLLWFANNGAVNNLTSIFIDSTYNAPASIITADLNADGYTDIITAYSVNNVVSWFRNNGDGSFNPPVSLPQTQNANGHISIAPADMDLDGNIDIVAAFKANNAIEWYKNDGAGNFSEAKSITSSYMVSNIQLMDLNGDNLPDIVIAEEGNNRIGVVYNNGEGSFTPIQILSTSASGALKTAITFLNDDEFADIVAVSKNDHEIVWFQNNGNSTFGSETQIGVLQNVFDIKTGDLNGDGFTDVVASSANGIIIWHKNNGNGTFAGADTLAALKVGEIDLHLSDFDGNGTLDIIAGNNSTSEIFFIKNVDLPPAPPQFIEITAGIGKALITWAPNSEEDLLGYDVMRKSSAENDYTSVLDEIIRDISHTDTGLANRQVYSYHVVAIDSSGSRTYSEAVEFTAISTQISRFSPLYGAAGTIVTIHGTGFPEALSDVEVRFGNAAATVLKTSPHSIEAEVPAGVWGLVQIYVKAEDVEYLSPLTFIALNANDASFYTTEISNGFYSAANMAAADVDGDKSSDLMVARPNSNGLTLFISEGRNPAATAIHFNYSGVSVKKVRSFNLDDDPYPDFAFISQVNNQFRLMRNTGNGAQNTTLFSTHTIPVNHTGMADILPADMDNDGLSDMIIASSGDGKISWYQNNSTSQTTAFGSENIITQTASGVTSIAIGDFNGDDQTDIIAALPGEVRYYKNDGNSFSAEASFTANNPMHVIAADIDNDGDSDLLWADTGSNSIILAMNDGGNFYQLTALTTSTPGVADLHAADINGDGHTDIIAASPENGLLYLLLNNGSQAFETIELNSDAPYASTALIYDFDGDGNLDIATRHFDEGIISVLRNIKTKGLIVENFIAGNNLLMLPTDGFEMVFTTDISDIGDDYLAVFQNAISIRNQLDEERLVSVSFSNSSLHFTQESFHANETYNFTISSQHIYEMTHNEFFIDVNADGRKDEEDDIYIGPQFSTTYLADFNRDEVVNFEDLVLFSEAWRSNDSDFELAPFVESGAGFPHIRPNGDNTYDVNDLVTFIRSWNHSHARQAAKSNEPGKQTAAKEQPETNAKAIHQAKVSAVSDTLNYIAYKKAYANLADDAPYTDVTYSFTLTHPDSVHAVGLIFDYDPAAVSITNFKNLYLFDSGNLSSTIFITHMDSAAGNATIGIANNGELKPFKNKEIAEITFRVKNNSESEIAITSDIRAHKKPAFVQMARQVMNLLPDLPKAFVLSQNYPNPFNPATTFHYELPEASVVSIEVYDILGRKVESLLSQESLKAGYYRQTWNASRYASGMYMYVMDVKAVSGKNHRFTKKMMLIK